MWVRAAGSLKPFVIQLSDRKQNGQDMALDKNLFQPRVRRHQVICGGLGVQAGAGAGVPKGSGTVARFWLPATGQPAETT